MVAITPDVPRRVGPAPVPTWAPLVLVVALALLWLVTYENGEVTDLVGRASALLHETFHDGRHLLGVPCH